MNRSSQALLRAAAVLALVLSACAKGATTLDEDANEADGPTATGSPSSASGSGASGSGASGSGGAGGSGATPCGNGRIDPGEDCDGSALGGITCMNLGFTGGTLHCDQATCMYDTSMCTRGPMGNSGNGG